MSISVHNVSKYYGTQKAVDSVSFSIDTGEIVGFIGPNGAGKTTIMKIITGYIVNYEGTVTIDGQDIKTNSLQAKKKIGYLPESNPLYMEMYVKEYLQFIAGIYKISNISTKVDEIIEKTGLTPEFKKKIGALSKGYKQRVGIAASLIHNPHVLILDEPTTGLDPNQIVEIRNLIANVGKDKTVLLSTHIMQEVEAICHKAIIINKGVIVAYDKPQTLKSFSESAKQTIKIEFNTEPDIQKLLQIEGISLLENLHDNVWLAESDGLHDIRSKLFKFAVENGLEVLSMEEYKLKLEEVFRNLTNN